MEIEDLEKNFPELMQLKKNEITNVLTNLGDRYGLEKLHQHTFQYADMLEVISNLNRELIALNPEKQELKYLDCVQKIMNATQEYYTYIGKLPEDIRKFFMLIADATSEDDGSLKEVTAIMGENFNIAPFTSIHSIRPKNYIMQIDAITNNLANLNTESKLKVGSQGKMPIHTTVTLDMPDHMRIEGCEVFSPYDKSIVNGVTSLLESGNTVFSVPMLYHAMTGKQNPTIDDSLFYEISGKLDKMRRMIITIDLSQEKNANYLLDEEKKQTTITDIMLEGYLLPLSKISGNVNGKKTWLYQILQHPPLYTYSKARRQLATVKISLLSAPVNNNSTTIPLKTYLLQRIELMRNNKNNIISSSILYESIYIELGAAKSNKTKKMRIRNYTTTILEYFVDQHYIKNYSEYNVGRSICGINIEL